MCANDVDWEEHETTDFILTEPMMCDSCFVVMPIGTKMRRHEGSQDGEPAKCHGCPVCEFGVRKRDHTPLHLCWGWAWDDGDQDIYENEDGELVNEDGEPAYPYQVIYNYIKYCLDNNEHPTVTGVGGALKQYQDANRLEAVS